MRSTLIDSQCTEEGTCAEGSWDPDSPTKDNWGSQGGRLFCTSLSTLTLEIYYRSLPIFKQMLEPVAAPVSSGTHPGGQ